MVSLPHFLGWRGEHLKGTELVLQGVHSLGNSVPLEMVPGHSSFVTSPQLQTAPFLLPSCNYCELMTDRAEGRWVKHLHIHPAATSRTEGLGGVWGRGLL